MAALVSVVAAALFLGAAWLWWHRIVAFDRRLVGAPRNRFQRRAEQVNRWFGTGFLTVCGLLVLSVAVRALLGG